MTPTKLLQVLAKDSNAIVAAAAATHAEKVISEKVQKGYKEKK